MTATIAILSAVALVCLPGALWRLRLPGTDDRPLWALALVGAAAGTAAWGLGVVNAFV